MPLVAYPDSDEDGDEDQEDASGVLQDDDGKDQKSKDQIAVTSNKRKRTNSPSSTQLETKPERKTSKPPPPLPPSFHNLYATSVRTAPNDDPSLHSGRKRQIPHTPGLWPSHVYLEWHPSSNEASTLQRLIDDLTGKSSDVHSLLRSDLDVPLPLHISLSRSLMLETGERDEFLERVRTDVKGMRIWPFVVGFEKVAWYPNYERNRWFLSLSTRRPAGNELNRLLAATNEVCEGMGQPQLYVRRTADGGKGAKAGPNEAALAERQSREIADASDCFHVSLAWSLKPQELQDSKEAHDVVSRQIEGLAVNFDEMKVKIGNVITPIPLG